MLNGLMTPLDGVFVNGAAARAGLVTAMAVASNVTVATPFASVGAVAVGGGAPTYDPMLFAAACEHTTVCLGHVYACDPAPRYCTAGKVASQWHCPSGSASCWSGRPGSLPLRTAYSVVFTPTSATVYSAPDSFSDLQHIAVCFALLAVVLHCSGACESLTRSLHLNWTSALTVLLATCAPIRGAPAWAHPIAPAAAAVHAVTLWLAPQLTRPSVTRIIAYLAIIVTLPEQSIGIRPASFAQFVLGLGCIIDCGTHCTLVTAAIAVWCCASTTYNQVVAAAIDGCGGPALLASSIGVSAFAAGALTAT